MIEGEHFINKTTSFFGWIARNKRDGEEKRPVGPAAWLVAVDVLGDGAFPKNEKTPHRSQKEDPTTDISALG